MLLLRLLRISVLTFAFLIPTSIQAQTQTYTWTGANFWYNFGFPPNLTANWNRNGNPNQNNTWTGGSNIVLEFNGESVSVWNPAPSVTSFTVNQLTANVTAGEEAYLTSLNNSKPFVLSGSGSGISSNGEGNFVISNDLSIGGTSTFNVSPGGFLILNNGTFGNPGGHTIFGGAGSTINVTGGGTVVWRNTTVENINVSNSLLITDGQGNFLGVGNANVTVGSAGIIDAGGDSSGNGFTAIVNRLEGTGTFRGNIIVTQNDGDSFIFAGQITDRPSTTLTSTNSGSITMAASTGSLTITGNSLMILTGNNTYTGGTTIAAGALQIGNGGTTGSIVGDITNAGTLAVARSDAFTLSGNISGTGDFLQTGSGTTTLTGNNTYSGGTTAVAGTLVVANTTGSATGSGSVQIGAGTTLAGNGTIAPSTGNSVVLNAGSTLNPGLSSTDTTSLKVNGDVQFIGGSGSTWMIDVTSSEASDSLDLSNGTGSLNFLTSSSNTILIDIHAIDTIGEFSTKIYTIATKSGSGSFNGFDSSHFTFTSNIDHVLSYTLGVSGNSLQLTIVTVPEPASIMLLSALSLGGIHLWRRRKANESDLSLAI